MSFNVVSFVNYVKMNNRGIINELKLFWLSV